ncbi:cytochrome P460 family protein [Pseudaestuariivita atlantica]|uniref:Recombinase n=1 Tax=Pseudaestuariivita atlantica TaxID=1317121 RepID=A0A0L1JSP1_9RHOB|nr:cytochrome P460 family protein [Pseudaestuariivita atlantica]KNG94766.1 recombinase [Pseudaestuariivita atlantica]
MRILLSATLALAASASATLADGHSDKCFVDATDPFDLSAEQVVELYACMEGKMLAGYTKGDNPVAAAYRGWAVTSTRPAVAGPHGDRFLQTFANDVAAEQYLKFEDEGVVMPAGSVLAKESFKLGKEGKPVRVGPLFIMTKGEAGVAPDTADWIYSAVQPNGKPMKIKQSFCHNCHVGWEDSDMLAYPLEEVRVSN